MRRGTNYKGLAMKLISFVTLLKDSIKIVKENWDKLSPEQRRALVDKGKELIDIATKK